MEQRRVGSTMPSVGYGNLMEHAHTTVCVASVVSAAPTMETPCVETNTRHLSSVRDGIRTDSMSRSTTPIGASVETGSPAGLNSVLCCVKTGRRQSHPIGAMPDAPRTENSKYECGEKAAGRWGGGKASLSNSIMAKGRHGKPNRSSRPIGASPPREEITKRPVWKKRVWGSAVNARGSMNRDGAMADCRSASAVSAAAQTDELVPTEWLPGMEIDECDL